MAERFDSYVVLVVGQGMNWSVGCLRRDSNRGKIFINPDNLGSGRVQARCSL